MKKLSNNELLNVIGGGISASMISAVVRGINTVLDLGRSVGSAIRRLTSGTLCSV